MGIGEPILQKKPVGGVIGVVVPTGSIAPIAAVSLCMDVKAVGAAGSIQKAHLDLQAIAQLFHFRKPHDHGFIRGAV
jgi:hypothetical protein